MIHSVEQLNLALMEMKPHFDSGFTPEERDFLVEWHIRILGKDIPNRACSDCYRDAYILLTNKIKTMAQLPEQTDYKLKAGIVEHIFGSSKFYVLDLPTEVAETILREHPEKINEFQRYPADWETRIKATSEEPATESEETSTEAAQKAQAEEEVTASSNTKKRATKRK